MDAFVKEAFALLSIGLLFIGLRSYVRITTVGWKGLQADDYLMWLAAILYSAETALAYSVGAYWHGLANNGLDDEERKSLSPLDPEYIFRVNGSKTQVAGWSTYVTLLWVIKLAMCAFYLRLTEGLEFKKKIHAGFVLIVTTWIAVICSILFGCGLPFYKNWQIYPDPGQNCYPAVSKIDIFVTVVLNVITDLYLLTIPIPLLWKASLRAGKKIGLIFLFSGGIFVTLAGILRCVLIITDEVNGAQLAGSWAVRETFVAVITSNMPMIFPLVNRWGKPMLSSFRTFSSTPGKISGLSRSYDPRSASYKLEDKNPRRGMGPRTANPITEFTLSGSEEHIVTPQSQSQIGHSAHRSGGSGSDSDVDLESGRSPGGILKETSLQVTEMRKSRSDLESGGDGTIGDYYLVAQARQSSEAVHGDRRHQQMQSSGSRRGKRSSMNFSRIRRS